MIITEFDGRRRRRILDDRDFSYRRAKPLRTAENVLLLGDQGPGRPVAMNTSEQNEFPPENAFYLYPAPEPLAVGVKAWLMS